MSETLEDTRCTHDDQSTCRLPGYLTHVHEAGTTDSLSRAVARGVRLIVSQGFRVVHLAKTDGRKRIEQESKQVSVASKQEQK